MRPSTSFRMSLVIGSLIVAPAFCAAVPHIEGYPTDPSVVQGGTLELHVRNEAPKSALSIWRQGRELERVIDLGVRNGSNFATPAQAWEGCGWPVTDRIEIPIGWRPGVYLARFDIGTSFTMIPFVVRPLHPGAYGPILVQISTNTWQAYNHFGGKNLYGAYASGLTGRATAVSYHRPYNYFSPDGTGQFYLWEAPFLAWLELQGYAYEVCTSLDLHRTPHLLDPYAAFVSVGHDEYYTKEMYDELQRYVDSGGNLIFFSGNTLWWQVRFEGDGSLMVCYKDFHLDPLYGVDNSRVTVNWGAPPVNRPPAALTGLYYNGSSGVSVGAYQVVNPQHWVYKGVTVEAGQTFGFPMVGYELDSRTPDSPPNLELIARAELPDADNNNVLRPCEMVYYERPPPPGFATGRSAKVFACGTVNYVQGLMQYYNGWLHTTGAPDPVATTVTRNVLDRLGCHVDAPKLSLPVDLQQVVGQRVMVQWQPGRAQRSGFPVHYLVYWQADAGAIDSLTTDMTNAWIPMDSASDAVRWWVRATAECGAAVASEERRFFVRRPTDALSDPLPPLVALTGRDQITFWLSTTVPTHGSVDIFDVSGRRIRALPRAELTSPSTRFVWDLRNGAGNKVPTGIYMVSAQIGSATHHSRVFVSAVR